MDSISTKGGVPPKNDYSVSKSFNPVAPTATVGSSYFDGIANGVNEDVMDGIRSDYNAWLQRYGKTANESRYPTFKTNVLALQENERLTGKILILNEFADNTPEEYSQQLNARSNQAPAAVVPASADDATPTSSGMGSSYLSSVAQAVAAATPQNYAPTTASATPPVAAATTSSASYLSSVSNPATGSGSPTPKKGYAPGAGAKPGVPASSGIGGSPYLSFVTQAASSNTVAPISSSTPAASAPDAGATGASYLSSMSTVTGSGSATPKKSYAPGAGGKSWGPGSVAQAVVQVDASVASSTPQSSAPSTPAPVAATAGASYLSSMSTVTGSGSATPKKSYAPGAGVKPMAPVSSGIGSSYLSSVGQSGEVAPQSYTPAASSVAPVATTSYTIGACGAMSSSGGGNSYLNSVSSGVGSGSTAPKKSYAPGAGAKPMDSASPGIGSTYLRYASTSPNPQDIGHKVADGTIVPKLFFAMEMPSQGR